MVLIPTYVNSTSFEHLNYIYIYIYRVCTRKTSFVYFIVVTMKATFYNSFDRHIPN